MTKMNRRAMGVALLAAATMMLTTAVSALAQEKPAPPPKLPAKVDVVISRFQGDKKVSSQPYTIVLNTSGSPTSLRLNVSTPMGLETTTSKDGDKTTSTRYQNIGTNIDCRVTPTIGNAANDTFDVYVNLNDSSLFNPEGDTKIPVSAMAIMQFSASNTLTMRNGQTMLLTTATNKVTGEVIKVEVTFTLLK